MQAVRLIMGSGYNAHTMPIFSELKILKLEDMIELQLGRFIYCLYNNTIPEPLKSFFSINSEKHSYNTRNRQNPNLRLHRTKVASSSVFSRAYKVWYNTESAIKQSKSLPVFVSNLKKFLIHKYVTIQITILVSQYNNTNKINAGKYFSWLSSSSAEDTATGLLLSQKTKHNPAYK